MNLTERDFENLSHGRVSIRDLQVRESRFENSQKLKAENNLISKRNQISKKGF